MKNKQKRVTSCYQTKKNVSNAFPVRSETESRGSEYAGHVLARHVAATGTDTGRPATGAPLADYFRGSVFPLVEK
jgi:hypothetical protein